MRAIYEQQVLTTRLATIIRISGWATFSAGESASGDTSPNRTRAENGLFGNAPDQNSSEEFEKP